MTGSKSNQKQSEGNINFQFFFCSCLGFNEQITWIRNLPLYPYHQTKHWFPENPAMVPYARNTFNFSSNFHSFLTFYSKEMISLPRTCSFWKFRNQVKGLDNNVLARNVKGQLLNMGTSQLSARWNLLNRTRFLQNIMVP